MKFLILSLAVLSLSLAAFSSEQDAFAKSRKHKAVVSKKISRPTLPGARCDLIEKSVVADLPHFCNEAKIDQVRLVDFGNQLDLLESSCGKAELALRLKKALNEKVHHKNKAGCIIQAEAMSQEATKAQASLPESGF